MNAKIKNILILVCAALLLALLVFFAVILFTSPERALIRGDRADAAGRERAALTWYLKAGRAGDPHAERKLGEAYEFGRGTRADYRKALIWYERCAHDETAEPTDLRESELGLGRVCLAGDHGLFGADEKNAYLWFLKAADRFSGEAAFRLYEMTRDGVGCEQNAEAAAEWYAKAAVYGYPVPDGEIGIAEGVDGSWPEVTGIAE